MRFGDLQVFAGFQFVLRASAGTNQKRNASSENEGTKTSVEHGARTPFVERLHLAGGSRASLLALNFAGEYYRPLKNPSTTELVFCVA